MKDDHMELQKLASLLRIKITDEEVAPLNKDLEKIKNLINQVKDVKLDKDEKQDYVFDVMRFEKYDHKTPMHRDREKKCLPVEKSEQLAPEFAMGHFVIPKVISRQSS